MSRDDLDKLLGGYATGTLTASERQALFEAALADQSLFESLADEQALKDLLDDPRCRREVLEAATAPRRRVPVLWRAAAALAVTAGLAAVLLWTGTPRPQRVEIAQVRQAIRAPEAPAPGPVAPSPPQPAARPVAKRRALPAPPVLQPSMPEPPEALAERQIAAVQTLPQPQMKAAPAALLDTAAAAPAVRYTLLARAEDGAYFVVSPDAPLERDTPVRLSIQVDRPALLTVLDGRGASLLKTAAQPGRRYTVDPPLAEGQLSIVAEPRPHRLERVGFAASAPAPSAIVLVKLKRR